MATPNIALLNAVYNGVSGVTLPTQGGGTATFPWVEGSQNITQNGTVDVTNLAQVVVSVSGGGGSGWETESGIWEPQSDTNHGSISFTNQHTEAPTIYIVSDIGDAATSTNMSVMSVVYIDVYKLFGAPIPYGNTGKYFRYSIIFCPYQNNNVMVQAGIFCAKSSSDSGDSSTNYARYWAKETGIFPSGGSTNQYFRSGRSYKWIAFWKP